MYDKKDVSFKRCKLGPVPLTIDTIKGELQKGPGGYFYIKCSNLDCGFINTVAYGKTYRDVNSQGRQGMPCFFINTKLGIGKIIVVYS